MQRWLNTRSLALTYVLAGIGLGMAFLPSFRAGVGIWLALVCTAMFGPSFILVYLQNDPLWWLLPCAGALFSLALLMPLTPLLPGQHVVIGIGIVLVGDGIGLAIAAGKPQAPEYLLAVVAAVLFAAVVLLLTGLGYRVWIVSLVILALGFDLAVTSLYLPGWPLRIAAVIAGLVGILIAPQPATGLRVFLPAALIVSGLALIQMSKRQPVS